MVQAESPALTDLINKSRRCMLIFWKKSETTVILWFGGDTLHGYDEDGHETDVWPVAGRLSDGAITTRMVQRAMNRAYETL